MNICLITPNVFPVPAVKGGACETLVETIIKENEKKKQVKIICVSIYDEEAYEQSKQYQNTEFIYIGKENVDTDIDLYFEKTSEEFINYMDKIYEKIKDRELDYIIIEGGDWKGYRYLLEKFPKEKCVLHLHGNLSGDEMTSQTYQYFLSISDYISKEFVENGIIEEDRVKLLYNGIELDKFKRKISEEEKQNLKRHYGITEEDTVIMFCGRTVAQKGIKELILALKRIENINNAKLLVVGNSIFGKNAKTEFESELAKISEEVKDKIIFTGFIHNNDLYKIHNISDIAVVPSISEEPFGLVIVEAMASGLPLIVTRAGGIPEIVNDKCAITIDRGEEMVKNLAKAIDKLIENPDQRRIMGMEGEKRCEKFSSSNFYDEFINIINKF